MDLQDKLRTVPREDEVLVEEKKIKCFGENYQAVRAKNKMRLKVMVSLVFGCLILSAIVLSVLVICGI